MKCMICWLVDVHYQNKIIAFKVYFLNADFCITEANIVAKLILKHCTHFNILQFRRKEFYTACGCNVQQITESKTR